MDVIIKGLGIEILAIATFMGTKLGLTVVAILDVAILEVIVAANISVAKTEDWLVSFTNGLLILARGLFLKAEAK